MNIIISLILETFERRLGRVAIYPTARSEPLQWQTMGEPRGVG